MKKILKSESIIISITLTMMLILFYVLNKHGHFNETCFILKYLKLYCPACGGTRAVQALFHLDIIASLKYNPLVLYTGISFYLYSILDIFRIYEKINNKKLTIIRKSLINIGLIIMIISTILKNI